MKELKKDNIIIKYSETLEELALATFDLLNNKKEEYKELFQNEKQEIEVNYFDEIEDFRSFIKELRNKEDSLPEYATGTFDNDMVNAYINPKNQMQSIFTASHEFFHIMYKIFILNNDYSKRIVWYDEGMAQFMSGEKDKIKTEEDFINFYSYIKNQTKVIPNLNEIEHGKTFCNENYDGYNLSYLSVKYLSEILSKEEFIDLMSDFEKIKQYGNTIINDAFKYFDSKYDFKSNNK